MARHPDLEKEAWREEDPVKLKGIMRKCEGHHDEEWKAKIVTLVKPALKEKIKQNSYIKQRLLQSGKRRIGEASTNMLWGIGLHIGNKNVFNTKLWKGKNVMGGMLEEIRNELQ